MKKPASLNTFIMLSTSIILSSCGGGNSKINSGFGLDAQLVDERPLTTAERNIATRICYAYQSKSANFRTASYLGGRFVFTAAKTDCANNISTSQITTTMNYDRTNNLAYIPSTLIDPNTKFFGKVQTDSSGYLSQLCPSILTNQAVSNTILQQNFKVQISFIRENLDGFILNYFSQQGQGTNTYKIVTAEKFKVRTLIDFTNGQILGMDEYYSTQQACNSFDKNKFSNFEQSFTSR